MTSYEKIKTLVPSFYFDVLEMNACYDVDGKMLDEFFKNTDIVKMNRFVLTADEETTESLEKFLGIKVYKEKNLDERRRLIAAYFAGFGKISKTKIKEMMRSFTGADCKVELKVFDQNSKDRALYVTLERGANSSINADDVKKLLFDRVPAHLMVVCSVSYTNAEYKNSGITYGYLGGFTYKQVFEGFPLEEVK